MNTSNSKFFDIGIVAPCSIVPQVELRLGVERLEQAGFKVKVHPQCKKKHLFYAGTHEERAHAFYDYAMDPEIGSLWCARGGYGAAHLLPELERLTHERGVPPQKILAGYSDVTLLIEFVRQRWNWKTLHSPMPGGRAFYQLKAAEWKALQAYARGQFVPCAWGSKRLKFFTSPPSAPVRGDLVGGNLTVWSVLMGTALQSKLSGKILFLEDISETPSRIDRTVQHIYLANGFDGVRAIVLGDFIDCDDRAPQMIKKMPREKERRRVLLSPKPKELVPLRALVSQKKAFQEIFGELGEKLGIPIAYGLPAGHGPGFSPLFFGKEHTLLSSGEFKIVEF